MSDPIATQQQILEFKARVLAGEQLTEDELRRAWDTLRAKRRMAADLSGTKSRSGKASTPVRSTGELMSLFNKPVTTTDQ
jgi:hypothetical protein